MFLFKLYPEILKLKVEKNVMSISSSFLPYNDFFLNLLSALFPCRSLSDHLPTTISVCLQHKIIQVK